MSGPSDLVSAIMGARADAMRAGMVPITVEIDPALHYEMPGAVCIAGLRIVHSEDPGVTVRALPNRRIGRWEVVIPDRFPALQMAAGLA